MNKNYSRNYVMEDLRGVGRPYRLEHPQSVHETRRETPTIYVALIDSTESRTADDFSSFHATRLPPVTVLVRPASLGSSALMFARSKSGI
jgi:hypothetical protein